MDRKCFVMTSTFYPPYHLGGDANHVKYLSKELVRKGHEVHVIHLIDSFEYKKNKMENILNSVVEENGVIIHRIKSPWNTISLIKAYTLGQSRFIDEKTSEIIKSISPDIIHHHNISGFGPQILRIKAERTLYTAHDYWLLCPMNDLLFIGKKECRAGLNGCEICSLSRGRPPQLWRLLFDINKYLDGIDVIIAPSFFMADMLVSRGIKTRIEVVSNFIEPESYSTNNLKLTDYFLYVGLLESHKGIFDLVKLFSKNINLINKKLVVVGTGSQFESIKQFVNRHGLKESIIVLGKVDQQFLSILYKNSTAVIIPSKWYENNPLVAIEALSYGIPLITSNKGGLPEITEKIEKRHVFNNMDDLKNILINFSVCDDQLIRIQNIYNNNYTVNIYMKKYLQLINK